MSKLDEKDVKHVAKLANISIDKSEIKLFRKELSEILNYVDELSKVDTNDVEATSQTTGLVNVTKKDKVDKKKSLKQNEATSRAAKEYNGYFVVPMILTERTDY